MNKLLLCDLGTRDHRFELAERYRPVGVFLTKRYDRISSASLGSAFGAQSKSEEGGRKTPFPLSPKQLVERLRKDVVSFRQKNTYRPTVTLST
jgi:hypothetical protein